MKKLFLLFIIICFCNNIFATPWSEEEYNNAPAMFRYCAWLQTTEDINNMKRWTLSQPVYKVKQLF